MKNLTTILIAIIIVAGVSYLSLRSPNTPKEVNTDTKVMVTKKNTNTSEGVKEFTRLLITKVLKVEGEVDTEDRLRLENEIRSIGDEKLLALWQTFVSSKTQADAEKNLWNLFEGLIERM